MRTDYRTCPICGAAIDPGEDCDCTVSIESELQSMRTTPIVYSHKRQKTHYPPMKSDYSGKKFPG